MSRQGSTSQPQTNEEKTLDAYSVKNALYARHPGSGGQMPGAWTAIEEFRQIDLLAISAWSSAGRYARVGYEVKVSRGDMRAELLNPAKRQQNVEWCNEFYFAVPKGLLTDDEIAWQEPDWPEGAFDRERCPNHRYRGKCFEIVPVPTVGTVHRQPWSSGWSYADWADIPCRLCGGRGYLERSLVEREAPTVWVPRDVGLVTVSARGTHVVRQSPRRTTVAEIGAKELGQLVRWVSMRPDPRHAPRQREEVAA